MMPYSNDDQDLIILKRSEIQNPEILQRAISRQVQDQQLSYLSHKFVEASKPKHRPIQANGNQLVGATLLVVAGVFMFFGVYGNSQYNRGREAGLADSQELIMKANSEKAAAEAATVQAEQQINQIRTLLGQ